MLKLGAKNGEDDFGKICLNLMEEAKKVFALPPNEKEKLVIDETSQNYYKGKIEICNPFLDKNQCS